MKSDSDDKNFKMPQLILSPFAVLAEGDLVNADLQDTLIQLHRQNKI